LTIIADNKTKKYKEANPELTASYNGFVYDDTVQSLSALATLSTDADINSVSGEYAITASNAVSQNYNIVYTNGKMTVEKVNTPPIVKQEVTPQSITIPTQITLNLLDVFSDADLDALTYTVAIADATIADVSLSGSTLTVLSKKAGETIVTITANDGLGGTVKTSFTTTVSGNLSTGDFDLTKKLAVRAYPNPANDVVNFAVQYNNEKSIQLKIYDLTGRLIGSPVEIKGDSNDNIAKIAVGHLQSGIYLYTLSIDNKIVFKDKIIIQ
jgi:hypothetical protein